MPVAEVSTEGTREDLKTLEGGYVVIRPLPYGDRLAMRDRTSRMSMEMEANQGNRASRRSRQQQEEKPSRLDFDMMQTEAKKYEFSHCIIEHNLQHRNGTPMDFTNPDTITVLDPRIGAEIEDLIDKHNEIDTEEDEANLDSRLTTSTADRQNSRSKEETLTPAT